jgi:hypothetical protein
MISPQKLVYNNEEINVYLNTFDVVLDVAFDSDNGETNSFLNRSAVAAESYDGRYKNTHRYKYDELFSPKFTIVKKDFSDFSQSEVRLVLKYLTQTDKPALLEVSYDKDGEPVTEDRDFCAIGGWTEINTYKLANNRTVAITATFEAVTPYAMSGIYVIPKDVSNPADNTITINLKTDEPQNAVYPRITIQQDSSKSVIEINHAMTDTDNWVEGSVFHYGTNYYWVDSAGIKKTSSTNTSGLETTSVAIRNTHTSDNGIVSTFDTLVKNNIKGETVVLDGTNRVVSSSRINGRIFGNDFDWQWIPLYEGKNELSFVGNCSVTIEYREVRKVGEF